jgi:hypothetical protein
LKFEYTCSITTDIYSIIITVNFFTSVQQVITGKMRRVCMYWKVSFEWMFDVNVFVLYVTKKNKLKKKTCVL